MQLRPWTVSTARSGTVGMLRYTWCSMARSGSVESGLGSACLLHPPRRAGGGGGGGEGGGAGGVGNMPASSLQVGAYASPAGHHLWAGDKGSIHALLQMQPINGAASG